MSISSVVHRRGVRLAAIATIAMLVGAGITYAAVPATNTGRISACYAKTGPQAGILKVIDAQAGQKCAAGQAAISWQANGLRNMKSWAVATTYAPGDVVQRLGASYIAIVATKGNVPETSPTKWLPFAAKGATGATGATGPAGPSGASFGRVMAHVTPTAVSGGQSTAMTIGFDGNPLVVFQNSTNDIVLLNCADPDCLSSSTQTIAAADVANVYRWPSIAIGANGNPIVVYSDVINAGLYMVVCSDPTCQAMTSPNPLTSSGTTAQPILTIGSTGNPVIEWTNNTGVAVLICSDPVCAAAPTTRTIDPNSNRGYMPAMTIGSNGAPVFAYHDVTTPTANFLLFASCVDATCSTANAPVTVATGDVGALPSITIGTDGNPVISYAGVSNSVYLAFCANPSCSTSTKVTVDSVVTEDTSVVIGTDGNPIVAYHDHTAARLRVAYCGDPRCATRTTITVDSANHPGTSLAMTLSSNGNPVMSYWTASTMRTASVKRASFTKNGWGD